MDYDDECTECTDALVLNMLEWAFGILSARRVFQTYLPLREETDDASNR